MNTAAKKTARKTAAIHCTAAIALVGALALPLSASAQTRTQAEGKIRVAQYCVPPDGPDTHRFFCRLGGG
jgi:hypothetical protein